MSNPFQLMLAYLGWCRRCGRSWRNQGQGLSRSQLERRPVMGYRIAVVEHP